MVGPSRAAAIFAPADPLTPTPRVISRTGQVGPPPIIAPGVNAPQILGCSSACSSAGNGVGGPPSGLKALGTTVLRVQEYGRGAYSRAIGGLRILLTPP